MNQQPDKLFREKLQGYQKPVSEEAWNRVSRNLRPGRQNLWLKIAAAVILLAVATVLLFPLKKEDPSKNIARETPPLEKSQSPGQKDQNAQDKKTASTQEHKESASQKVISKQKSPRTEKARTATPQRNETESEPFENHEIIVAPEIALMKSPEDRGGENNAPQNERSLQQENDGGRVTIIFTAEEVNKKYLDKKELAEATPEDKKSSSLRKLLDKAYDLKHNQDPLGELRQKKNEILAFNFKNERQQHE